MLAGLAEIAGVGRAALDRRGGGVDSELTVRAIISMVTATAVFRPLIFGGEDTDVDNAAAAWDLTVMAGCPIGGQSRRAWPTTPRHQRADRQSYGGGKGADGGREI